MVVVAVMHSNHVFESRRVSIRKEPTLDTCADAARVRAVKRVQVISANKIMHATSIGHSILTDAANIGGNL